MSAEHVETVIATAKQADPDRWEQQREWIRRSGARYERSSRNWRLELDLNDPQGVARALGPLFAAARNYGATVLVVDPPPACPRSLRYRPLGPRSLVRPRLNL